MRAVAWAQSEPCLTIHSDFHRDTGDQSILLLHLIVASRGHYHGGTVDLSPSLSNAALFERDRYRYLYCS